MKATTRNGLISLGLLGALIVAAPASAITFEFGGADDPSLHGATGSLEIEEEGDLYRVTWSMDFDGFVANNTHEFLTHVAFKAFRDVSSVSMVDDLGNLYTNSNVRDAGCDAGDSPAGFVCVDLDENVVATDGGSFSMEFLVDGTLLDEVSYRGKFGLGNGWVISESSSSVVPEPSAALLFAIGGLVFGGVRRSRR